MNAFQPASPSLYSAFVAKISPANAPAASLHPASLLFGNLFVHTTSASQTITLSDMGTAPLSISQIAITGANSGDFAQSNNCGTSLAGAGSCTITVTFTPAATGPRSAAITVTDSAAGSPHTASLSGTGTIEPVASYSPTYLDFEYPEAGITSAPQTVTLQNTGNAAMAISSIAVSSPFGQTNNCGSSLAVGASCAINVTFTAPGREDLDELHERGLEREYLCRIQVTG